MLRSPELCQRERRRHEGFNRGNRRNRPAHLLQQHAKLDQPHAGAAVLLRNREPKHLRFGELPPCALVEPGALFVERLERVVGHDVGEHLLDEVADALLVLGK